MMNNESKLRKSAEALPEKEEKPIVVDNYREASQNAIKRHKIDENHHQVKPANLNDGYSTPQTVRSRISIKRVIKAFDKSERRLQKQFEKSRGVPRRVPDSRGTIPRFGMEHHPYHEPMYGGLDMRNQPMPNIHYVHSSFERQHAHGPCRLPCCVTPNSVVAANQKSDRQKKSSKDDRERRSSSESKKVHSKSGEAVYMNTITNNYYHIKRKNGETIRQVDRVQQSRQLKSSKDDKADSASKRRISRNSRATNDTQRAYLPHNAGFHGP